MTEGTRRPHYVRDKGGETSQSTIGRIFNRGQNIPRSSKPLTLGDMLGGYMSKRLPDSPSGEYYVTFSGTAERYSHERLGGRKAATYTVPMYRRDLEDMLTRSRGFGNFWHGNLPDYIAYSTNMERTVDLTSIHGFSVRPKR